MRKERGPKVSKERRVETKCGEEGQKLGRGNASLEGNARTREET